MQSVTPMRARRRVLQPALLWNTFSPVALIGMSKRRIRATLEMAAGGLIGLALSLAQVAARPAGGWATLQHDGSVVQVPRDVFVAEAGEGTPRGRVLRTPDGRAHLHVFTVRNERGESPAQFLARVFPRDRGRLTYERVARNFFAVSQPAGGKRILYRRCNFVGPEIHCVDLQYPLAEKRAFDGIVTRISLSLRPR